MKHKNQVIRIFILGIIGLSLTLVGCAVKKQVSGDPETGLNLKYSIARDQVLNYKNSTDTEQTMDVMGQSMKTTSKTSYSYAIKGTGTDEQNNLMTQVTINDLNMSQGGMQGDTTPDTSALKGKSFGITFSPIGKEIKFTGIDELPKISTGQMGGEGQSVNQLFTDILPDLPENPIKVGETWTDQTDNKMQQGPLEITMKGESTNLIEGLETVNGKECIRIKTQGKNKVDGSGDMMGNEIKINGEVKVSVTWYFAYKEGIFVKASLDQTSDLKINMGEMGEMPQTAKTKQIIELVQ